MITRRSFLITGLAGSAALVTAYWLRDFTGRSEGRELRARIDAAAVLSAIAPVMLADALPEHADARSAAVTATVARVQGTIARLSPRARHELAQLFALLAWPPSRLALAGLAQDWTHADAGAIEAMLEAWRTSALDLKRSAYAALHQLVLGAWYADAASWARIGYPGPPQL
ncbi:MAG TPA: hypothetical protein VFC24_14260 [Casimicrobiaceae bacterium]|nr:hypothetical protein [Casimicrobiaceae bacterium]